MKIKTSAIIVLLSLFFTVTAFAETNIKAEVDKAKLSADEDLVYKVTITSSEKNLSAPLLPKFTGFNIISSAQSSTVSFIRNNIKSTAVYVIILHPAATGKFKIEPSQLNLKGKVYSSQALEVEVTAGKAAPRVRPEAKPSPQKKSQPRPEGPQVTL